MALSKSGPALPTMSDTAPYETIAISTEALCTNVEPQPESKHPNKQLANFLTHYVPTAEVFFPTESCAAVSVQPRSR